MRVFGINFRLRQFFGGNASRLPLVTREFPQVDLPNLQTVFDEIASRPGCSQEIVGYVWNSLAQRNQNQSNMRLLGPLRYRDMDIGYDATLRCVLNGVRLLNVGGEKFAVFYSGDTWGGAPISVEVLTHSEEKGSELLREVRELVTKRSVYRGKVITLEEQNADADERGAFHVRFHEHPAVTAEEIVLPEETLRLVERNSVRFFQHAEALRRSGRSLKRGLLLHGEPGTGKTLTIRWLASTLKDVTVIQLAGEQLWQLKECCRMARLLAPSLVIMEDVDLIAAERHNAAGQTALHQLLNEMDGLTPEAEVIFVLTTNRPESIEDALKNRPGRVDQAIHFPLPDPDCRLRLLKLFSRGLSIDGVDLPAVVARTEGASPAYIRELVRKAALIAAEEERYEGEQLAPDDECFRQSSQELVTGGGSLTKRLLGFGGAG